MALELISKHEDRAVKQLESIAKALQNGRPGGQPQLEQQLESIEKRISQIEQTLHRLTKASESGKHDAK